MAADADLRFDLQVIADAAQHVQVVRGRLGEAAGGLGAHVESVGHRQLVAAVTRLTDSWSGYREQLLTDLDALVEGLTRAHAEFEQTDREAVRATGHPDEAHAGDSHEAAHGSNAGHAEAGPETHHSLIGRWAEEAEHLGRVGMPIAVLGAGTRAVLASHGKLRSGKRDTKDPRTNESAPSSDGETQSGLHSARAAAAALDDFARKSGRTRSKEGS